MNDLVASSSPRGLLASSQRLPASVGGLLLLGLGVLAVGKGASPISASSGALTWDDVSTGLERSPSLWGGVVNTTMGFSLFGVEFADACPDMSNNTWDRHSLSSMVMLTSLSTFGRVALTGLGIMMEGQMPEGSTFSSGPYAMDCGMSTFR